MSYDIFFVRRDPGQTFEDALDGVEDSYESGDPGPLTEEDLELWEAVLPQAREILGDQVEITQHDEETRELTDPATGIGITLLEGELEIHVPHHQAGAGSEVMSTVYDLARALEEATGLEGYDPQLDEPVSDTSDTSPTRRRWDDDSEEDENDDDLPGRSPTRPVTGRSGTSGTRGTARASDAAAAGVPAERGRWWEFWKS
jgi:hypothetical protein